MIRRIIAVVVVIMVIAGTITWRALHLSELAFLGAGYAAQQTCACVFIAKRNLESCRGDLDPLAQKMVSISVEDHAVIAASLVVFSALARYDEAYGCSLQD
jgi:hypothetical protein